jgi:hypothetical protein
MISAVHSCGRSNIAFSSSRIRVQFRNVPSLPKKGLAVRRIQIEDEAGIVGDRFVVGIGMKLEQRPIKENSSPIHFPNRGGRIPLLSDILSF